MKKAVFLDRDGTINVEKHYLYKIEDFVFLPGVIEGLKLLQDAGFILIIITNQSGIGRGYYSENDFHRLNDWMLNELKNYGVEITKVYYCPHLPGAQVKKYKLDCDCRKPKLGLFTKAIMEFDIDLANSYVIGDKIRDCAISETSECCSWLINDNEAKDIIERVKANKVRNVKYATSFIMAAKKIVDV